MSTSSPTTSDERKVKMDTIKAFWKTQLFATPLRDKYVAPKLLYKPSGETEQVIRCFGSELDKGDVLVEFVGSNFDPIDANRTLYLLPFDPDYRSKYQDVGNNSWVVKSSYLVKHIALKEISAPQPSAPASLSEPWKTASSSPAATTKFSLGLEPSPYAEEPPFLDELEDAHASNMTIRDWYAVLHNKPVSSKGWLNTLIRQNQR